MSGRWGKLADRLSLPEELLPDVPRITLTGKRQVMIENPGELLSYTANAVDLGCGRCRVRVLGEELLLCAMNSEFLLISGIVSGVEVDGT